MKNNPPKIAIVHDWLTNMGGAEKVALALHDAFPGAPIYTSQYAPEKMPEFGKDTPMKRPGQPNEVAPSFLFLACDDSSYMTGQVLHPDGGDTVAS